MAFLSALPKALSVLSELGQKRRLIKLLDLQTRHSYDRILMAGLLFHGYHGAIPAENTLGQKFVVDAVLFCDLKPAGISDKLSETVNYAEVYDLVKKNMEGPPKQLLESVAHNICTEVLQSQPLVQGIQLALKKPHVAVTGPVDHLGIQIMRWRDNATANS